MEGRGGEWVEKGDEEEEGERRGRGGGEMSEKEGEEEKGEKERRGKKRDTGHGRRGRRKELGIFDILENFSNGDRRSDYIRTYR